jgi:hypothetical protein
MKLKALTTIAITIALILTASVAPADVYRVDDGVSSRVGTDTVTGKVAQIRAEKDRIVVITIILRDGTIIIIILRLSDNPRNDADLHFDQLEKAKSDGDEVTLEVEDGELRAVTRGSDQKSE